MRAIALILTLILAGPAVPVCAQSVLILRAGTDDSIVSVLDHGAIAGDGLDDSAALQAAVDKAETNGGGVVFVPEGTYNHIAATSAATIALPVGVSLVGETHALGKCKILRTGTSGTLIDVDPDWNGIVANLTLQSTGHCIDYDDSEHARFSNLRLTSSNDCWAMYAHDNAFDCLIDHVRCTSAEWTGNGIMLGAHTTVTSFNAAGCDEAIRIANHGAGVSITGFRIEVCNYGVKSGFDEEDVASQASLAMNHGSFEACGRAIVARGSVHLHDVTTLANDSNGTYPYTSAQNGGIVLQTSNRSSLSECSTTSNIDLPSLILEDVAGTTFHRVSATCSNFSTYGWSASASVLNDSGNQFNGCNVRLHLSDTLSEDFLTKSIRTHSLQQIDGFTAAKQGKNLRGINVPVTEAATTAAVVFPAAFSGGSAAISTATAANTGAATLAEGTYYYTATGITAAGECNSGTEKTVVVANPNNSVTIACFGTSHPAQKRRIYRGTASGVYDGYYDVALNTDNFTDTGAAFTGLGPPPPSGVNSDNSMVEPDANYGVTVTPNWLTTTRVHTKATTGFSIEFGTAAPANATVDYIIVR